MPSSSYATVADFLALPDITSDAPADNVFIEDLLARASRAVDVFCGTWFYANTQTRYYNLPYERELCLDAPLLSVTTLTNGDDSTIASTEYNLLPFNRPHYTAIKLFAVTSVAWQVGASGETEGVISVAGSWGYVDRSATDPESLAIIGNTQDACLLIAQAAYKKRYGVGAEGVATVTGAGVVITPRGIPADARQVLMPYVRMM